MNRQERFDENRQLNGDEMDDLKRKIYELEAVLRQQEHKILQQNQQLEAAANQQIQQQQLEQSQQQEQLQQQQHLQQIQQQLPPQQCPLYDEFGFNMTAKDIIEQFRRLKPLDEKHSPRSFIHAVEANLTLCGNNENLAQFCIRIVANEKILGNAGRRVRELQENVSWEETKKRILQEYRPKRTYGEIFNHCRSVKVRNLNELFSIFEKSKFEINDIYLADQSKPSIYKPENVDRDLVDILLEKIDGPIRAHIGEHETLSDIILKYTKLKLLDDTRAIAFNHRNNIKYNTKQNYNWQQPKPNNNFQYHNNNSKNSEASNSFQYRPSERSNRYNSQHQNSNYKYYGQGIINNRNSVHQSTPNNFPSQTKSNQTRNSYYSKYQRQTNIGNQEPEAMEIDSLQHDVNFIMEGRTQTSP